MNHEIKKITVIGAGSWGTTLAVLLAKKGFSVTLWCRRIEQESEITRNKQNKQYLPGIILPSNLRITSSIQDACDDTQLLVLAVPAQYARAILRQFCQHITKAHYILHVIKGIEQSSNKLISSIIKEELGDRIINDHIAVLSGPNHAEEISRELPTATVIASSDMKTATMLCSVFQTNYFKVYPLDDVEGVEICGALKNIFALAMGVCDGLELGDNAKASIITLGLAEMGTVARAFGAKRTTCFGLAGVGDLIATCYSDHSRNRKVGLLLAQGKSMQQIQQEMHGMVAEGVSTTKAIYEIGKKKKLTMPLITQAYEVLYNKKNLESAMAQLLKEV